MDILKSLDKSEIYSVGFKAESDLQKGLEHARAMLEKKGLDAVCFNDVSQNSFGSDENAITLITKKGETALEKADKFTLSLRLLEEIEQLGD